MRDPVCGMALDTAAAAATVMHAGTTIYFCSDECRNEFVHRPDAYSRRLPGQ